MIFPFHLTRGSGPELQGIDTQWVWPGRIHGFTSAAMGVDDQGFWVEFGHHEGTAGGAQAPPASPWTDDWSSDFGVG